MKLVVEGKYRIRGNGCVITVLLGDDAPVNVRTSWRGGQVTYCWREDDPFARESFAILGVETQAKLGPPGPGDPVGLWISRQDDVGIEIGDEIEIEEAK